MTTQLEEKFSAASSDDYASYPNANFHGPSNDVLTCDGICHTPRALCLAELERVMADHTLHTASCGTASMRVWLRMARDVLRKPGEDRGDVSGLSATRVHVDRRIDSFAWSTPEGAARVMTGPEHPLLSLPAAVCAPVSGVVSAGHFRPLWVQEALGFITAQAAGCSFDPCVAVTRSTTPASRVNQISAWTGLGSARVGNLATAGLSGFFYLALHRPEDQTGPSRAVCAFFNGLPYADELSVNDQGGEWSHLSNLAGPLLGAEKLLSGALPELFDRVLLSYHCCTLYAQPPSNSTAPSMQTLFLARFYDSTLPSFLDCLKCLDAASILPARATVWGTLLSNDVFDYVSDGLSGRVANLCWAIGSREAPVECARMFRGCVVAAARAAHYAPGALFALLYMEFVYLYTARYCYYSVPCDLGLPLDDTYIPFSLVELPTPGAAPVYGFRAALRAALSAPSLTSIGPDEAVNAPLPWPASGSLPDWPGLTAIPCAGGNANGGDEVDMVATRGLHDILGCLDRGIYPNSPGLYYAHLGWLVRQYDALVVAGRDNLGVGRYYAAHRVT